MLVESKKRKMKLNTIEILNNFITFVIGIMLYINVDWGIIFPMYLFQFILFTIIYLVFNSLMYWELTRFTIITMQVWKEMSLVPFLFYIHLTLNQLMSIVVTTIMIHKKFNPDYLLGYVMLMYIGTSIFMIILPGMYYDSIVWNKAKKRSRKRHATSPKRIKRRKNWLI